MNMTDNNVELPVIPFGNPQLEPIKISVTSTTYYLNKKANTVGCRLAFNIKGPDAAIEVINALFDYDCCEVTAEAKLNPADEFDYETGKRVARAKAESMAYNRVSKLFARIAYKMTDVLNAFTLFVDKADRVITHNNEYLSKF